eukprot:UN02799
MNKNRQNNLNCMSHFLTGFGVYFSFVRRYNHVHFYRICSDIAIFCCCCKHHAFLLIFSILMRVISLNMG